MPDSVMKFLKNNAALVLFFCTAPRMLNEFLGLAMCVYAEGRFVSYGAFLAAHHFIFFSRRPYTDTHCKNIYIYTQK